VTARLDEIAGAIASALAPPEKHYEDDEGEYPDSEDDDSEDA
jgi:hypothetical protein